jgi:hypothetical protein
MAEEKKKLTFQEIAKQRLAEKKAQQSGGTFNKGPVKVTNRCETSRQKKRTIKLGEQVFNAQEAL